MEGGSLKLVVVLVLHSLGFEKLVRAPELRGKRDGSGTAGGLRVKGYVQVVLGPGRGTRVCRDGSSPARRPRLRVGG